MRAEFLTPYPSSQIRAGHPEPGEQPHPRAVEMASRMAEEAGAFGSSTREGLLMAGFTSAEIIEFEPAAIKILKGGFIRQIAQPGDRVPDVIAKAVASAAHNPPKMAGVELSDEGVAAWRRFCTSRAAFKLDPWVSQSERCLNLLKAFLRNLPVIEREANRIIYAIAAEQKADLVRGRQ